MTALTDRLSRLTPAQRKVLTQRLVRPLPEPEPAVIPRLGPGVGAPLSFGQERIWTLEQLFPELPSHHIVGVATLVGALEVERLFTALDLAYARHGALRTAIEICDGKPRQTFASHQSLDRSLIDLSAEMPAERERQTARLMREAAAKKFDLAAGRLIRVVVFRLSPTEHKLFACMHHIASDGWSTGILLREIFADYTALSAGRAPTRPALPIDYLDYADWQRRQDRAHAAPLDFWATHLAGFPTRLDLPVDFRRTGLTEARGERLPFDVPDALARTVHDFARRENVTVFMVLLAAYGVVLHRHCGQARLTVGAPTAGRDHLMTEGLVGCFLNMIAVPLDATGDPSFREFLGRVRNSVLGSFEHSSVPFEQVLHRVRPERETSASPLFQTTFSYEREPLAQGSLAAGVAVSFDEVNVGIARYDLSLELTAGENRLRGWFDYRSDLFARDTIQRLLRHFLVVLGSALRQPDALIERLECLEAMERTTLSEWSGVQSIKPSGETLAQRFAAQAHATPEAIAIEEGDRTVTYGTLLERAEAFAAVLAAAGVGPGAHVGLCSERSIETIAAIVGIIRAGAAYVPIDPQLPDGRIRALLAQTGARAVVVAADLITRLAGTTGLPRIVLRDECFAGSRPAPTAATKSDSVAYVMYTSGSTGEPKGVAVTHRAIIRLVRDTAYARFAADETFLLLAPLAFDASTFEIWGPLLNGGRLVIAPRGPLEFAQLGHIIAQHGVTTLWLTAGYFQRLAEEAPEYLRPLRQLLAGGDVLPVESCRRVLEAAPQLRLINGYGPTEATTFTCCHRITLEDTRQGSIPIGRPIAGTSVYVLDRYRQPVPIGVTGELYIGGGGVAVGYINDPALTAEKFPDDPFALSAGEKMYRTGDYVRFRPDGVLEFLGRGDGQVKIRGFRIELGAIESALHRYPSVKAAAVIATQESGGTKRLHAYVVPRKSPAPTDQELRSFLTTELPDYMIPAHFTSLDRLPLSANGKIDKQKLPAPDQAPVAIARPLKAGVEQGLAAIWQELLHKDSVGPSDNFFELGGDSIQAIQLVAKAARIGLPFRARDVFDHQTLAELAVAVEATASPGANFAAPTVGSVPLTPIQSWFFNLGVPNPSHWNQWVLVRLEGELTAAQEEEALRRVVTRHDAFRLRFHQAGATWSQELVEKSGWSSEWIDFRSAGPACRAELVAIANRVHRTLDLTQGPLFRAVYLEGYLPSQRHVLLIAHHLIVDAVSWFLLLGELEAARNAPSTAETTLFPSAPPPFARWAELRAADSSLVQTEEQAHPTPPPEQRLRVDFAEGTNREVDSEDVEFALDTEATTRLRRARRAYRTRPDELLVMALARALYTWNGGKNVPIALETTGRTSEAESGDDASQTVGWLTAITDIEFASADDEREFITRAKGVLRHATPARPTGGSAAEIALNYLGEFEGAQTAAVEFGLAGDREILARDPLSPRPTRILVEGFVRNGTLWLRWTYAKTQYAAETIAQLAATFRVELSRLVAHCLSPAVGTAEPADFPLAPLTGPELDRLAQRLGAARWRAVEDIYSLTPLQEGILFQSITSAAADVYLVQFVSTLRGAIDEARLREAWRIVLNRHPALRTSFHHDGLSRPVQIVETGVEIPWSTSELGCSGAELREVEFRRWLQQDREQHFDLTGAPAMRVHVARCGAGEIRMVWTHHHLILDGWSLVKVLEDLFSTYEDLAADRPVRLPPPPRFREFIKALGQLDLAPSFAVWQRELQGFSAPTPLPVLAGERDEQPRPGPAEAGIPSARLQALLSQASAQHLTLATLIQGAWALALDHYAETHDVVFGSAVAGRTVPVDRIDAMVGLFINTVPLRVPIAPHFHVSDWLTELQARQTLLRDHEHCGLAAIQGMCAVKRRQPLFESAVAVENYPLGRRTPVEGAGLRLEAYETIERIDTPLLLMAIPGESLRLRLFFDTRRFPRAAVQALLEAVTQLIVTLGSRPASTLEGCLNAVTFPAAAAISPHALQTAKADIRENTPGAHTLEQKLATIWARLLEVDTCGIDDDFFELGGHSLVFMRMRGELLERLALDIPVVDLMQHPTVRSLAAAIAEQARGSSTKGQEAEERAAQRRERFRHRREVVETATAVEERP